MLVCEYIAEYLKKHGISVVFGYQGGNISFCIDAIKRTEGIEFIETRHEQAASFAANGVALCMQGKGCAVASSGPGAINLLTGVANAWFDSLPVIFIVGDVSAYQGKTNARQDAFQAAPITEAARPFCKYTSHIRSPEVVKIELDRAMQAMENGRPGPALLSIAHFVQRSNMPLSVQEISESHTESNTALDSSAKELVFKKLSVAQRTIMLLGGGAEKYKNVLSQFLSHVPMPVVCSLRGLNAIDHTYKFYSGMIGDYGHRRSNRLLAESDCVIVLGARLDERQTWAIKKYNPSLNIIHADYDPAELYPASDTYLPLHCDISYLVDILSDYSWNVDSLTAWGEYAKGLEAKYPLFPGVDSVNSFLSKLSMCLPENTTCFADVGLNQMLVAQNLFLSSGKRLYSSCGLGSMGFAVPAAVGAAVSQKQSTVAFTGDGGLQMSIAELETVVYEKIPVKIVLLNNNSLGMIKELQSKIMNGRFYGSVEGYSICSVEKLAEAYGIKYFNVDWRKDISEEMKNYLTNSEPVLFELKISENDLPFPNGPDELF